MNLSYFEKKQIEQSRVHRKYQDAAVEMTHDDYINVMVGLILYQLPGSKYIEYRSKYKEEYSKLLKKHLHKERINMFIEDTTYFNYKDGDKIKTRRVFPIIDEVYRELSEYWHQYLKIRICTMSSGDFGSMFSLPYYEIIEKVNRENNPLLLTYNANKNALPIIKDTTEKIYQEIFKLDKPYKMGREFRYTILDMFNTKENWIDCYEDMLNMVQIFGYEIELSKCDIVDYISDTEYSIELDIKIINNEVEMFKYSGVLYIKDDVDYDTANDHYFIKEIEYKDYHK